jgi:hypothetical protein
VGIFQQVSLNPYHVGWFGSLTGFESEPRHEPIPVIVTTAGRASEARARLIGFLFLRQHIVNWFDIHLMGKPISGYENYEPFPLTWA